MSMSDDTDATTGSGEGGSLGTPTSGSKAEPPSADQDANGAVSGGGMVDEDDAAEEKDTACETGPDVD